MTGGARGAVDGQQCALALQFVDHLRLHRHLVLEDLDILLVLGDQLVGLLQLGADGADILLEAGVAVVEFFLLALDHHYPGIALLDCALVGASLLLLAVEGLDGVDQFRAQPGELGAGLVEDGILALGSLEGLVQQLLHGAPGVGPPRPRVGGRLAGRGVDAIVPAQIAQLLVGGVVQSGHGLRGGLQVVVVGVPEIRALGILELAASDVGYVTTRVVRPRRLGLIRGLERPRQLGERLFQRVGASDQHLAIGKV